MFLMLMSTNHVEYENCIVLTRSSFNQLNSMLNSQYWFTMCMYSSLIFCSLISALHQATRDSTSKQGLHYCCRTMGPNLQK